jgi:hypothetical protein
MAFASPPFPLLLILLLLLFLFFSEIRSYCVARLALNSESFCLSLQNSWNYRHELLSPAILLLLTF